METVHKTRIQLLGQLRSLGLVRKQPGDMREHNLNSDSWAIVKAALCAGLYPNLARVDREQNVLRTRRECKVSSSSKNISDILLMIPAGMVLWIRQRLG